MDSSTTTSEQRGDEDLPLWEALAAREPDARERIFLRYSDFARRIAWQQYRSRNRGDLELGDIQQFAFTGLLEAVDRFDPLREVPFEAFARRRIAGSISDGVAGLSEVRRQLSWHAQVRRERMRSLASSEVAPMGNDLAEDLARVTDIAVGLAIGFLIEGMADPVDEGLSGSSGWRSTGNAYESAAWRELLSKLTAEIATLPEREAMILRQHYICGLGFAQLCQLTGLSAGRISQLHRKALIALRKKLAMRGYFKIEQ
jgi:RNA polymerase sigma factor for flagellar operon FliA